MIIFRDCIAPVPLNLAIVLTTWSALHPQGRPGHINEYPKRFVAEQTCRQQATGLRSAATHMPRRVPRFMRSLTRTCVIILLGQSPCLIVSRHTTILARFLSLVSPPPCVLTPRCFAAGGTRFADYCMMIVLCSLWTWSGCACALVQTRGRTDKCTVNKYGVAVVVFLLIRAYIKSRKYPRCLPLPPGPKAVPILGNVLDLPLSKQWLAFDTWADKYGDVLHINLLGQPVIVLSSVKSAADLLDKRSAKYSDRFKSTVTSMIGWDWNVALMGYGPQWRQTRRAFHEHFHQGAVRAYQPSQLSGVRRFLTRLLADPDNFVPALRYDLGATILDVSYGIKAEDTQDEYIAIGERAVEGPAEALVLGALWVEFLPILRHVPPWFPGASYQKKAAQWRKEAMKLKHEPFKKAIADFHDGAGTWSLASEVMHRDYQMDGGSSAGTEELAKNVAAVTYGAGADTSFSTLQTFFLAMALYPEVQRKAQAELDAVIGPDRLPEFADQDSLPYIHAVVQECLRWQNVFPLGLPHRLMEDDEYKGYYIPKGSIVLANIWTIAHDPRIYTEPDRFNPDRYFIDGVRDSSVLDPISYVFGFGRRECPGRHFAVASIYIYVASVLQVFNITPKRDVSGNLADIKPDVVSGVVTYPAKFECDIKPRTAEAEALIRLCLSN